MYRAIYDFATTDLSALYFDVLKDRLYTAAPKSRARRSGQSALYRVHYALTRLAAPLLAFTTEEIWGFTPKPEGAPESVHMARMPEAQDVTGGLDGAHRAKLADWDKLIGIREQVLKALEEARQAKFIGTSLEARVRLAAGGEQLALLQSYRDDLPALFIVSEVVVEPGDTLRATVERASGTKCERCWKYSTDVGLDERFPTVCAACGSVLREMGY